MNEQPKPCPFCGETTVHTEPDGEQGCKFGAAVCGACLARGPEVRTDYDESPTAAWRAAAIEAWNERVST